MLRLRDSRTGRPADLPGGPAPRVHVLDGAGLRTLVVADLLRRAAERAGRRVRMTASSLPDGDWTEYSVKPIEETPVREADVYVTASDGAEADALLLTVPHATGGWDGADPLSVRLAMLDAPYREPLHLTSGTLSAAAERLDGWRTQVARWATGPGRPMDRRYAAKAEAALADDLGSPAALAVLDELAADPDVPPGAKLETVVHLDLILGLNLVAAIGTV
ncbi:hypothetical protein [Actinomadura fibrosa]|uniref:Uncharacterized protein n=1 Tax=Actinomadura fibrosa TaxID=111802 RepID=A0ABW2XB45_9ACTN|nr:hypothetical protein [Actinomadura fibrosa]